MYDLRPDDGTENVVKGRVTISPATYADFVSFVGSAPPCRVQAWVGKVGDLILGIGGMLILPDGGRYAFLDLSPEARTYSHALHRAGLKFVREVLKNQGGPVAATISADVERAGPWLERLGFTRLRIDGTDVYVFRPD